MPACRTVSHPTPVHIDFPHSSPPPLVTNSLIQRMCCVLRTRMNQMGAMSKFNAVTGYDVDDSEMDEWDEETWEQMASPGSPGPAGPRSEMG